MHLVVKSLRFLSTLVQHKTQRPYRLPFVRRCFRLAILCFIFLIKVTIIILVKIGAKFGQYIQVWVKIISVVLIVMGPDCAAVSFVDANAGTAKTLTTASAITKKTLIILAFRFTTSLFA